jgi:diguanylate cyclase
VSIGSAKPDSNGVAMHMAHMERLYDQSPLMVALFDGDDVMRYANKAYAAVFRIDPAQSLSWSDLMRLSYTQGYGANIETDDIEAWLTATRARRGKQPYRTFETDLTDGRWIHMTETVDEQGWVLEVAFDVTALRVNQRSLRVARDGALRAAQVDALTGVSNRPHLMQQLSQRAEQLLERGQPCGVVMLDLDHFKAVNDTYGHYSGDLVLKHFAQLVAKLLRREDGFGRLGGEEFLLICPKVDAASLERLVARLLAQVASAVPLPEVPDFRYSCSAGLVMLDTATDPQDSVRAADRALYEAKARGRAQLVWA